MHTLERLYVCVYMINGVSLQTLNDVFLKYHSSIYFEIFTYFLIPIGYIYLKEFFWYPLSVYKHHARTFIFRLNHPSFNSVWNDVNKLRIQQISQLEIPTQYQCLIRITI